MKRYHTLTQAHINHACKVVDHKCFLRKLRPSDRAFFECVKAMLLRMGFNPRQVARADDV